MMPMMLHIGLLLAMLRQAVAQSWQLGVQHNAGQGDQGAGQANNSVNAVSNIQRLPHATEWIDACIRAQLDQASCIEIAQTLNIPA